jgi:hypothetical protein
MREIVTSGLGAGGLCAKRIAATLFISLSLSLTSVAQQKLSPLAPYVKEDAPVLVLVPHRRNPKVASCSMAKRQTALRVCIWQAV